ncbi:short-chain dehydrogenase [Botryosphaeria dothidea]|uniref:Short-chain dehydrogenase n=1 Tax=Botryosphaeria dothidea TaxID=55169 RepID=A0A8H4IKW8_9PEZI|nr:short-chain dehydrogenase [Botryosphaeria dothidea]
MYKIQSLWNQGMCIPKPQFGEANVADQSGRVIIVTGGYAGIGYELCKILYRKNGTVYIAGRSKEKFDEAEARIRAEIPTSSGSLTFLQLDLANLDAIKASADDFLSKEKRLDVLVNNAGVMFPPDGSKTEAGHELQIATNGLGPFLFTQYLLPVLRSTAASSPQNSVRVTWATSLAIDLMASGPGMEFNEEGSPVTLKTTRQTMVRAKFLTCSSLLSSQRNSRRMAFSASHGTLGTYGLTCIDTLAELRRLSRNQKAALFSPDLGVIPPLFAGWSSSVTMDDCLAGEIIIPWDRKHTPRQALLDGLKPKPDGGESLSRQFWSWCHRQTSLTESS